MEKCEFSKKFYRFYQTTRNQVPLIMLKNKNNTIFMVLHKLIMTLYSNGKYGWTFINSCSVVNIVLAIIFDIYYIIYYVLIIKILQYPLRL